MKNEFYHVYCNKILSVKTNIRDFAWVYGSVAVQSEKKDYQECAVKFDINLLPEKELSQPSSVDDRFQSFMYDNKNKTLFYRRTMFKKIQIGYNIKVNGNKVEVEIGKNYYRFVKQRVMNLHAMYYLLSDVANVLLLKNGYLSLYASAVHYKKDNKGAVIFSPPNTGKTTTAMKLSAKDDYSFVSEDVVITDGKSLYSCPYTSSYRAKNSNDSSGSFGRITVRVNADMVNSCALTDIVMLSRSKSKSYDNKAEFLRYIDILNGYLFNYYSSPIVKVLGFFDEDFLTNFSESCSAMLKEMVDKCDCHLISAEDFTAFDSLVHSKISGED